MCPEYGAVFFHHPQLAHLRFTGVQYLFAVQIVDVLVFLQDEAGQKLIHQLTPGYAKQGRGGKVSLKNKPVIVDGNVSHRSQIVEVEVARRARLQLLVLHFQLDLMHAQLVERLLRFFGRYRFLFFRQSDRFFTRLFFGPPAHGSGLRSRGFGSLTGFFM